TVRFVGREEMLAKLQAHLQSGSKLAVTAIRGMGGIGKTELALQYAITQFSAGSYPGGICWLSARDQEIATQITTFAQSHLGLTLPELEIARQVRYCWQWWPAGEVLVVIDDVTDYKKIEPYLPPSDPRFKLLLTTRLNLGRCAETFSIQELDVESSLVMLIGIVGEGRIRGQISAARKLCEWVGCLPLGLELLGRYLANDEDLSVQALLDELQSTRLATEALQEVAPGMTANLGALQALELSWRELCEMAQGLACVLGMFAVAPIPWELVEKCFDQVEGKTLRKKRNKELLYRSLLKRVGEGQYQLNQVVQEFFRVKLTQQRERGETLKTSFCAALTTVAKGIDYNLTLAQASEVRTAIVHIEELGKCWTDSLNEEDFTLPFVGVGNFYEGQGLYSLAMIWRKKCLEEATNRFGESHPAVATSLNNLANLYSNQGRYEAAEPLYKEALALRRALLGESHPAVATSLNNLAGLCRDQGRFDEAEPLYRQALEMYRMFLSESHPAVASSLNNLAGLCRDQGRFDEAESLYKEALALYKSLLGDHHPDVAGSLNNLAELYRAQGRYESAEPLYKEALALYKLLLGDRHPDVATSLNNLALLYSAQGQYESAEPLLQEALALRQSLLGDRHPDVATSLNNLALLYFARGQYESAEPLLQEALALRQSLLGDRHSDVAITQWNLGVLYQKQDKYAQARTLYEQALPVAQAALGAEHPHTKGIQSWLNSLPDEA
ncbi:MAG: tetratricopeptide repeat protein, partial [Phormidesmis sp.]